MGFQHLPKERRTEIAMRGAEVRRSEPLKKAWAIASKLKDEYDSGKPPSVIAEENAISVRAVYRIVGGK